MNAKTNEALEIMSLNYWECLSKSDMNHTHMRHNVSSCAISKLLSHRG